MIKTIKQLAKNFIGAVCPIILFPIGFAALLFVGGLSVIYIGLPVLLIGAPMVIVYTWIRDIVRYFKRVHTEVNSEA